MLLLNITGLDWCYPHELWQISNTYQYSCWQWKWEMLKTRIIWFVYSFIQSKRSCWKLQLLCIRLLSSYYNPVNAYKMFANFGPFNICAKILIAFLHLRKNVDFDIQMKNRYCKKNNSGTAIRQLRSVMKPPNFLWITVSNFQSTFEIKNNFYFSELILFVVHLNALWAWIMAALECRLILQISSLRKIDGWRHF